ncbi:MAG: aldo/keto reductase [Acidobacteria bacterium]|nr:aldo/keto reductase [Acidobacteriota bacterium]
MEVRATAEGTAAYRDRFSFSKEHFHQQQNLWLSSIGLGTYLGQPNEITDITYQMAINKAVELGCNIFDTAINYRSQRSERVIGNTLQQLFQQGKLQREQVVIATKGGFIPFDPKSAPDPHSYRKKEFIDTGIITDSDIIADCHCMTPHYIENQLNKSLQNLGLKTIDIYYLHNPETQLEEISLEEFYKRIREVFRLLEKKVDEGKISFYGTATWYGYRRPSNSKDFLDLTTLVKIAEEIAGKNHHFRFIQLPYNLAMPEAFTIANQTVGGQKLCVLDAAKEYGITIIASASILQSRLAHNLPKDVQAHFPGLQTDAQRSIQFVRSTPGVTTALVGMSQKAHSEENLRVANIAPLKPDSFLQLFEKT